MKSIFLILLLVIVLVGGFFFIENKKTSKSRLLLINDKKITVEIANTQKLREQGLSGRSNLPMDNGMLFIFQESSYYPFWMKDMKFPLDFVWIDGNTIVDLSENIPVFDKDNNLSIVTPKYPADKILEINSGKIKILNIKIGDKISLL